MCVCVCAFDAHMLSAGCVSFIMNVVCVPG